MTTASLEVAKHEMIAYLRHVFTRREIISFARTFYPVIYRDIQWTVDIDAHNELVEAAIRHGLIDQGFFVNLYLCRPSRYHDLLRLARHFVVEPEFLTTLADLVPFLQRRRLFAMVGIGVCLSLMGGAWLYMSRPARDQTVPNALQRLVQGQIEDCIERHGAQSELCSEMAETLRSFDLSNCPLRTEKTPRPSERSEKGKRSPNDVTAKATSVSDVEHLALEQWLTWKRQDERAIREHLSECQRTLVEIAGMPEASTCPKQEPCVCPEASAPTDPFRPSRKKEDYEFFLPVGHVRRSGRSE